LRSRICRIPSVENMKDQLKSILPLSVKRWLFNRAITKQQEEWKAFAALNPGDTYHCNFCGHTSGAFLTDGEKHEVLEKYQILSGGLRKNSRCPNCGSKDRDRLIRFFIERKTNLTTSSLSLLHFAPEPSLKSWFKTLPFKQYINVDLNPLAADEVMDITKITLPDDSQDVIICNHVLEHIPDDALAMRELHRVLKPNGWAILQVPISLTLKDTYENWDITSPSDKEIHFGQCDHVRIYGQDYISRLQKEGFQVEQIDPAAFLSQEEIEAYGLLPEEVIYYCKKLS